MAYFLKNPIWLFSLSDFSMIYKLLSALKSLLAMILKASIHKPCTRQFLEMFDLLPIYESESFHVLRSVETLNRTEIMLNALFVYVVYE